MAVQDSEPLSVKVTGSLPTGAPVVVSVRVPETGVGEEKSPVTGLMVRVVGDVVDAGGCVATFDFVGDGEAVERARVRG